MNSDAATFPLIPEVLALAQAIQAAGGRPVLVGGWVRDWLLGHPHSKDYDLEVFGLGPKALQKVLQGFGPVHQVGRHFGVLKLSTRAAEYDVGVPRRESKTGKGHKGFFVETDPALDFPQAAARRDFTINSMGYAPLEGRLLDPFGGRADLEQRILRHVGPAFGEDPLRVLRAMQFAGRFGLTIAHETLAICRAQDLDELPRERMWEEFRKLLLYAPRPSVGLAYAPALGVLRYFPELQALHARRASAGGASPWQVTLAVVDAAAALRRENDEEANLVLMLAALTEGLAPRATPAGKIASHARPVRGSGSACVAFLGRLTNEQGLIERVWALVRDAAHVGRAAALTDGDVRRLALRVPLPALLELALAVSRGAAQAAGARGASAEAEGQAAADLLRRRAQALDVWSGPPQALLQGRHLLTAGMQPGPAMGRLLREAFERQLDGDIATLDDALCWARDALAGAEQ